MVRISICALALAACGGKQAKPAEPTVDMVGQDSTDPADTSDAGMIPPEQIEEVQRLLERRRVAVSRCLAPAVDAKELPKSSRGKVRLAIVVGTAGKAESVKVISTTLESTMLTDCIVAKVHEIAFPTLPKSFETSYAYGVEAM